MIGIFHIFTARSETFIDTSHPTMNEVLHQSNVMVGNNTDSCTYLSKTIGSWVQTMSPIYCHDEEVLDKKDVSLLSVQVLPVRCPFQDSNGYIRDVFDMEYCSSRQSYTALCDVWNETNLILENFEKITHDLRIRQESVRVYTDITNVNGVIYKTTSVFNHSVTISYS